MAHFMAQWHTLDGTPAHREISGDCSGVNKLDAVIERDLAITHADTGYVERHALAFEIQENSVTP